MQSMVLQSDCGTYVDVSVYHFINVYVCKYHASTFRVQRSHPYTSAAIANLKS